MLFSAIGKVAAPLLGDAIVIGGQSYQLEYVLVPAIAVIVIVYGVLGGLTAAYWTDMVQGIFIILLSIMLVPFGLHALIERFGDPSTDGLMTGFRIMHEQLPAGMFQLVGSANSSEFPLYRIVAVTLISLIGIVVQPHFIATGGGSAKTELNARVGLVAGNLAKRFCTIGWAITALIVLALFADNAEVMSDPDRAWGIASRELLVPGLRGLMLACLLAALMSSADTYMLVSSALIVRNIYIPFVNKNASESACLTIGFRHVGYRGGRGGFIEDDECIPTVATHLGVPDPVRGSFLDRHVLASCHHWCSLGHDRVFHLVFFHRSQIDSGVDVGHDGK